MSIRNIVSAFILLITVNVASAQTDPGCVTGDCTNGMGTYVWSTKQEYTGEWTSGIRTGLGVYDWNDGSYYYGYFQNGILEGKGVYMGNDDAKTTLIGTFHDGKLAESNNFIATGCILGNCYQGVGVYLWDNNDMYIGNWESGERSGYGRFDWADGSFYTGSFKKGLLDGRGYYSEHEGKKMDGYFENNVFVRSIDDSNTETSTSSASKPVNNIPKGTISGTYNDICTLLQNVTKGYADDFAAIQGDEDENSVLLTKWKSTVKLSGSTDVSLQGGFVNEDVPVSWTNLVYTGTDFNAAKAKYNSYVSQFSKCICTCCTFSSSEKTDTKNEDIYTTSYDVTNVNSGFDSSYSDLEVQIELKEDSYEKNWKITLRVDNLDKY